MADAGNLTAAVGLDLAGLRAGLKAIADALKDQTEKTKGLGKQLAGAFDGAGGAIKRFAESTNRAGEVIQKVFGADATTSAKRFAAEISKVTGFSSEEFRRMGEGLKTVSDGFKMAALFANGMTLPILLTVGAILLAVSAVGQLKKKWKELDEERQSTLKTAARAFAESIPGIGGILQATRVASTVGGPGRAGVAADAAGGAASAFGKAFLKDFQAGLEEMVGPLDKIVDRLHKFTGGLGASKDALKAHEDGVKAARDLMKKVADAERQALEDHAENVSKALDLIKQQEDEARRSADEIMRVTAEKAKRQEEAAAAAAEKAQAASDRKNAPVGILAGAAVSGSPVLGKVVQGVEAGGLIGGIAGLLSASNQFGALLTAANGIFQAVADLFGQMLEPLMPVLDVVGELVNAVLPALSIAMKLLNLPLMLLATAMLAFKPQIESLIYGVQLITDAIMGAWNGVISGVQWVLNAIGDVLDAVGLGDGVHRFASSLDVWKVGIDRMTGAVEGTMGVMDEAQQRIWGWLQMLGWVSVKAPPSTHGAEALTGANIRPEQVSEKLKVPADEAAKSLSAVAKSAEKVNEQITNMPSFYRIAAVRAGATAFENSSGPIGAGGGGRRGGSVVINVSGSASPAETAREVVRILERRAFVQTGSPVFGGAGG